MGSVAHPIAMLGADREDAMIIGITRQPEHSLRDLQSAALELQKRRFL
jgi:hypothetical protein